MAEPKPKRGQPQPPQRAQSKRQRLVSAAITKHPQASHRTLAKNLHHDHPEVFTSVESARTAVRQATGNHGEHDRKRIPNTSRPPRKPGEQSPLPAGFEHPPLPKSEAKSWEPFVLDARRVLILSDLHLPYHCEDAIDAALAYGDAFRPDAILINGDLFDMYAISRFDKDPTKPKILAELEAGKQLFAHLRSRFPSAPIHLKLGNHDERWDLYLQRAAPLLCDIEAVRNAWHGPAGIVEHGITIVRDQRPVMLGKLPVFHGHELGKSIFSPVNPARGAFLRAHHTILVGHSHQTSGHADTNIWHEETFCWSCGCLCQLHPDYARVNRWNHGFATVTVDDDGLFNVQNLRIANGVVRSS